MVDKSDVLGGLKVFSLLLLVALVAGLISHLIAASTVDDEGLGFSEKMRKTLVYNGLMTFITLLYVGTGYLWLRYSDVCRV